MTNKIDKLISAAYNRDLSAIKLYLLEGGDINAENSEGETIIYGAINNYSNEVLDYLIDKGITCRRDDLLFAVYRYNKHAITRLLDKGFDINDVGSEGNNYITTVLVDELRRDYQCLYNHFDIIEFLLDKGLDVDGRTADGTTLLMAIVCRTNYDSKKIVELLLERGAKHNLLNKEGESALRILKRKKKNDRYINEDILEMLEAKIDKGGYLGIQVIR